MAIAQKTQANQESELKRIEVPPTITVRDLAELMNISPIEIIKVLMGNGIMSAALTISSSINMNLIVLIMKRKYLIDIQILLKLLKRLMAPVSVFIFIMVNGGLALLVLLLLVMLVII